MNIGSTLQNDINLSFEQLPPPTQAKIPFLLFLILFFVNVTLGDDTIDTPLGPIKKSFKITCQDTHHSYQVTFNNDAITNSPQCLQWNLALINDGSVTGAAQGSVGYLPLSTLETLNENLNTLTPGLSYNASNVLSALTTLSFPHIQETEDVSANEHLVIVPSYNPDNNLNLSLAMGSSSSLSATGSTLTLLAPPEDTPNQFTVSLQADLQTEWQDDIHTFSIDMGDPPLTAASSDSDGDTGGNDELSNDEDLETGYELCCWRKCRKSSSHNRGSIPPSQDHKPLINHQSTTLEYWLFIGFMAWANNSYP